MPPCRAGTGVFAIRGGAAGRERLRERICAPASAPGIHYQRRCTSIGLSRLRPGWSTGLENSERAADEILSLPIYPQLSDAAVDRVVTEIRRFFR